ncbi:adenylyltransferase and sulfurtransferase [Angomonas deanei]|nr:adenylyltransferase and sulfurtransferase [Angomonas deanei]|eukprot:EPY29485.1 adenylyltransferase and sulfurtransferase [Angomonas deanei]
METDNVASRYIINDAAMLCKRPLVSGSAMRWEGQLSVYGYKEGPCYRCLFPVPPPAAAVGSCNDTGVVGPLPGMIGCLQALETLKIIADAGETLSGRLFVFDGRRFTSRVVKLRGRNPDCTACGASALSSETLPPREEYVPTCCAVGAAYSAGVLSASQRTSIEEFGKWYTNRHTLNTPDRVSLVVDVRARIQYSMAYLPDSVNLPLSELQRWRSEGEEICRFKFFHFLEEAIKSSEGTKHVTVFFICRRGVASTQATELLSKVIPTLPAEVTPHVTLDRIVNVDGGLNAYHSQVDAGFPYY